MMKSLFNFFQKNKKKHANNCLIEVQGYHYVQFKIDWIKNENVSC